MAILNRDQILSNRSRKVEKLAVPEWGGEVLVQSLTGRERDAFEASMQKQQGGKVKRNLENFRARLVSLCMVNEAGELLFVGAQDLRELGDLPVDGLQRVFNKCNEMNGLSDDDVDELTQDFDDPTPAVGSTTDSPSPLGSPLSIG